jgi:hypothetical protein
MGASRPGPRAGGPLPGAAASHTVGRGALAGFAGPDAGLRVG